MKKKTMKVNLKIRKLEKPVKQKNHRGMARGEP